MKPFLTQPSSEQFKALAGMRTAPQWPTFMEWLEQARDDAVELVLTCGEVDISAARSHAAALNSIIEALETAPEAIHSSE